MGYFKEPKVSTVRFGTSNKGALLEELKRTAPLRTDDRAVILADAIASLSAGAECNMLGPYMLGVAVPEANNMHSTVVFHNNGGLQEAIYMLTEMVLELAGRDAKQTDRILNQMKETAALKLLVFSVQEEQR